MTEDENLKIRKNDMMQLERTDAVTFFIELQSFEDRMKNRLNKAKSKMK